VSLAMSEEFPDKELKKRVLDKQERLTFPGRVSLLENIERQLDVT
jgi:hypothetical protein